MTPTPEHLEAVAAKLLHELARRYNMGDDVRLCETPARQLLQLIAPIVRARALEEAATAIEHLAQPGEMFEVPTPAKDIGRLGYFDLAAVRVRALKNKP